MTKIFLAGAEDKKTFDILMKVKARDVLMSYYYLRQNKPELTKQMLEYCKENNINIFLDSGAYSFMNSQTDAPFEKVKEYANEYAEFIKNNQSYFEVCAELDIDTVFGIEKYKEINKIFEEKGVKPAYVHHFKTRTMSDFEEACKTQKFIAIGGLTFKDTSITQLASFLDIAKRHNTKIHGFGFTRFEMLKALNFYSVDSTSWLSGARFGATYQLKGNSIITLDKDQKSQRGQFKEYCNAKNLDFEGLLADDPQAVNTFNAAQWVDYDNWLQEKFPWTQSAPEKRVGNYDNSRFNGLKRGIYAKHPEAFKFIKCPYQCEKFKEKYTCEHVKRYLELNTSDLEGMKKALVKLINFTGQRYMGAMIEEEKLEQNILDKSVDRVADAYVDYVQAYKSLTDIEKGPIINNTVQIQDTNQFLQLQRIEKVLDKVNNDDAARKQDERRRRIEKDATGSQQPDIVL